MASSAFPACSIYSFKWVKPSYANVLSQDDNESFAREANRFIAALIEPLEHIDQTTLHGKCVALISVPIWSVFLVRVHYHDAGIAMPFIPSIPLPIYGAANVLFRPFGEFMTLLGGSLSQFVRVSVPN